MSARIKPVVKLRKVEFERRVKERFRSNEQAADAMFLDRTSYWRAVRGQVRIGAEFIAGAIYGLNCSFDDIFRVVMPDPTTIKELHSARDKGDAVLDAGSASQTG